MCSLPGLPTPGSEVHVLITRVNPNPDSGFVELWVNMDDQRKPIYEKMTKDIQIYKKEFNGLEGKPGDLCLVCVSDIWHRARIVSTERETYTVFLIDQGEARETTSDALAWCQCDSFLLPPEIESCILANVLFLEKNIPEKISGFLNSLRGKKLKGVVQHVLVPVKIILLHIPIVSMSLCKAGVAKKVPVDEFSYLAEKNHRPPKEDDSEANNKEQEQSLDDSRKLNDYFYPELLTDTFEIVNVTSVTNPENIFCKLNIFSKALMLLTEQMQIYYKDCADSEKVQLLTCGCPCAARRTNGRWHRSLLKQNMVDDGNVEVLHVDEGQTESVPVENIKPLHWKFLKMPVVTYLCYLKGVEDQGTGWTSDQIDHLKLQLLHRTFVAKFDHHDASKDIYSVSLYSPSDSSCINSCFMENAGLAKTKQDSDKPIPSFLTSARVKQSMDDQVGKLNMNAHASQEKSLPGIENQEFNGRPDLPIPGRNDSPVSSGSRNATPLVQSNGHLSTESTVYQEFADSSSSSDIRLRCNREGVVSEGVELSMTVSVTPGQILSQVQHDQVLNVSKDATVPNKAPLLQEVNGSNDWTADEPRMSSQSFRDVCTPKIQHEKNNLDAGGKPTSQTFLYDDSGKRQDSLPSCARGNMKICTYKWPDISPNKVEDVYAACIGGPHYFWCQYTNTEELNKISSLSQEAGEAEALFLKTLGPGSPCLALFASDNQWYRAQVISIVDDTFHVLFIDYGNDCDVNSKNVKPLPQSLLEKPPQVILCSLNGFNASEGSWIDSVYDDFYTLLVDKPLKVTILNEEDHTEAMVPRYAVQVECENVIVNDAMLKYWKPVATEHVGTRKLETENSVQMTKKLETETPVQMTQKLETENTVQIPNKPNIQNACSKRNTNASMYKNPKLSKDKKEDVYASSIVDPNYFWCQYANTGELTKVSRLCQEAGEAQQDEIFFKTLGPGSPCLALFDSDNQWYRAQVIRIVDDTFHVLFIDYGNESDVDSKNVRPLPQSLLEKPPQAFLCSLNGFNASEGSWIDSVYDDFYTLLVDKLVKVTVLDEEDHTEAMVPQYAVQVEYENMIVNDAMLKYWKPVATEHVSTRKLESENSVQMTTYLETENSVQIPNESNAPNAGSERNANACMYKNPKFSKDKLEDVYASCIVDPNYFWCQYANTGELTKVSRLCQEAGEAQQDEVFLKTLGPGSPCLALFDSDNQWYRAQVIRIVDDTFHVRFIDYGNESDVDSKNVRPLPQSLLEKPPQAFLCSLTGFNRSEGSWIDSVYDDFYTLLVDKLVKVTVLDEEDHTEAMVPQYAVQVECENMIVNDAMLKYWKPVATEHVSTRKLEIENSVQMTQKLETENSVQMTQKLETENSVQMTQKLETENLVQMTQKLETENSVQIPNKSNTSNAGSKRNTNASMYKNPKVPKNKDLYASSIVDPNYFWCQNANTEQLTKISRLCQEVGEAQQDEIFLKTLGPGSPCLALFDSDNQWYRAQVIRIVDDTFHVLFIDYGNESDVDNKNMRPLPQSLLGEPPQAFLCSLNGFNESEGSWVDEVYDDFYNLLVDRPLKLRVINRTNHSEIAVPQHMVEIDCEGVDVNAAVLKYWEPAAKKPTLQGKSQKETSNHDRGHNSNVTQLVSKETMNTNAYKEPTLLSNNQTVSVYATHIVEPNFFWCQYANTEELNKVSNLCQKAGEAQLDKMFLETLGPGSPCLALFDIDNQWRRAEVIHKVDDTFSVLFIDYGNECDVDVQNVRPLPQSMLEKPPQAFLCSLNGFDESKGTWDNDVFEAFPRFLTEKCLRVTVINRINHIELAVPQYVVEIQCDRVRVNTLMEEYWKDHHKV